MGGAVSSQSLLLSLLPVWSFLPLQDYARFDYPQALICPSFDSSLFIPEVLTQRVASLEMLSQPPPAHRVSIRMASNKMAPSSRNMAQVNQSIPSSNLSFCPQPRPPSYRSYSRDCSFIFPAGPVSLDNELLLCNIVSPSSLSLLQRCCTMSTSQ